jgi:hypothetical protein
MIKREEKLMGELEKILSNLNKVYELSQTVPIRIKVNEEWLQKQLEEGLIKQTKAKSIGYLYGIPVEVDNNIESFEFVYNDFHI